MTAGTRVKEKANFKLPGATPRTGTIRRIDHKTNMVMVGLDTGGCGWLSAIQLETWAIN